MKWINTLSVTLAFVTAFSVLLFRSQINPSYAEENRSAHYANISVNHPYYDAIQFADGKGWLVYDESFHPDNLIQKDQFINTVTRALFSTHSQPHLNGLAQSFYSGLLGSGEPIRYHEALRILFKCRGFDLKSESEFDSHQNDITLAEKYRFYIPQNNNASYDIEKMITWGEAVYLIRQTVTFHPFNAQWAADYANKYWEEGYIGIGKFHCYCSVRDAGDCANFISQCILAGLAKTSNGKEVFASRLKFQDRSGKYVWWFNGGFDNNNDGEMDLFQDITASFETAWYQYQYLKNQSMSSSDLNDVPELIGMITEEIQRGGLPDVNRLQVGDIAFLRNEKTGETIHTMIVTEAPNPPTVHNVKINQRNITAKFCQYDASEGGCPFGEETVYERVNNHPCSDSWYIYRVLGFRTEN